MTAADGMQQRHPIVSKELVHAPEEDRVLRPADMLEHANADDGVKRALRLAIVLQAEVDAVGEAGSLGAFAGDGALVYGERDPR